METWSNFDPDATGFIKLEDFPYFMFDLGEPLGWGISYFENRFKQQTFIERMDLPTYCNFTMYAFQDVLENLALLQVIRKEMEYI